MGFRLAAVLSTLSFLLGIIFTCLTYDIPLLYTYPKGGQPSAEALAAARDYYLTLARMPNGNRLLLHSVIAILVLSLVAKLHRWNESAVLFDGSSLFLTIIAIGVYTTSTRQYLKDLQAFYSQSVYPLPLEFSAKIREALQVLAAANSLIGVVLLAILGLQLAQQYAEATDERARRAAMGKARARAVASPVETKKAR